MRTVNLARVDGKSDESCHETLRGAERARGQDKPNQTNQSQQLSSSYSETNQGAFCEVHIDARDSVDLIFKAQTVTWCNFLAESMVIESSDTMNDSYYAQSDPRHKGQKMFKFHCELGFIVTKSRIR